MYYVYGWEDICTGFGYFRVIPWGLIAPTAIGILLAVEQVHGLLYNNHEYKGYIRINKEYM